MVTTLEDYPIIPPIKVKENPCPRELGTIQDARDFVSDAISLCGSPPWRELKARLDGVQTEEDAFEAISALHDVLTAEELLA